VAVACRNFIPPNIGKNTHPPYAPLVEIIQQPLHRKGFAEPGGISWTMLCRIEAARKVLRTLNE